MLGICARLHFQASGQVSWHRRAVPMDMLPCRCSPDRSCATSRKLQTRRVTLPGWTAHGATRTSDDSRSERVAREGPCTSSLSQPGGNASPRDLLCTSVLSGRSAGAMYTSLFQRPWVDIFSEDVGCIAHLLQLALEPPLRRHLQRPASSPGFRVYPQGLTWRFGRP